MLNLSQGSIVTVHCPQICNQQHICNQRNICNQQNIYNQHHICNQRNICNLQNICKQQNIYTQQNKSPEQNKSTWTSLQAGAQSAELQKSTHGGDHGNRRLKYHLRKYSATPIRGCLHVLPLKIIFANNNFARNNLSMNSHKNFYCKLFLHYYFIFDYG